MRLSTRIASSAKILRGLLPEIGRSRLYIFISNFGGKNRLYKNLGNGLFKDVAKEAGVIDPFYSFTSWFWDYDNDDD